MSSQCCNKTTPLFRSIFICRESNSILLQAGRLTAGTVPIRKRISRSITRTTVSQFVIFTSDFRYFPKYRKIFNWDIRIFSPCRVISERIKRYFHNISLTSKIQKQDYTPMEYLFVLLHICRSYNYERFYN